MFSVADFVTTLGWFGAVAGAAAYLLVSRGRWNAASARYQSANLAGAGLMGGVAAFNGVWPSAMANLIWVVIGGQALWVIVAKKRAGRIGMPASTADADVAVVVAAESVVAESSVAQSVAAEPGAALSVDAQVAAEAEALDQELADEVWEERDPTLRMSTAELAALTSRGVAAAA